MTDEEIDTSDIAPLGEDFFSKAELRMPPGKEALVLCVDSDLVDWFNAQGAQCHKLINTALRDYVEAHRVKDQVP